MKTARLWTIVSLAVVALALSYCTLAGVKTAKSPAALALDNIDSSVKPGNDFFRYTNGKWLDRTEIPSTYTSYGVFTELYEQNVIRVKALLDSLAALKTAEAGSVTRKISDFMAVGLDSAKAEELGTGPLAEYQSRIKAISTAGDLMECVFFLQSRGYDPMFDYGSESDPDDANMVILHFVQGGLGLPDQDYYLNPGEHFRAIRDEYVKHIAAMLVFAGYDAAAAKDAAGRIMALETGLARISMPIVDRHDPIKTRNLTDLKGLKSSYTHIPWDVLMKDAGISYTQRINVQQPGFYTGLDSMLAAVNLNDWKDYLQWNLINRSADFLNNAVVMEDFNFYSKFLSGQQQIRPRWKRVQSMTNRVLGEAVGQLYVAKYFPPAAKERMTVLVENLRTALGKRIDALDWMSDATKKEARKKLATINVKIGYPEVWRDYTGLDVKTNSYFENMTLARIFQIRFDLDKIGKPVDRSEWGMTPQTVNAYYSPNMNEIVFPAAILQPPFFNMDADDAVNYGAIGVVIGHEISHGFDDSGRQYDAQGNVRDWWTAEDNEKFTARAQVLIDQFSAYTVLDSFHVNGKLTLGENIGDLGGLLISYDALNAADAGTPDPMIDGLTRTQRFLLSYAGIWKIKFRDQALIRRVREDPHSPGMFRVNGALRNFAPFYSAFDVTPDDSLYIAPEQRAHIW